MVHEDNNNLATSEHDDGAINTMIMEKNVEEANLITQELNDLGLGEDISTDKFRGYLCQLPQERDSPVDISTQLNFDQLDAQNELHELYRVKYYKLEEVLMCFENDGTLDSVDDEVLWEVLKCFDYTFVWYFHPEYCKLAALVDYQRLVIKNYGCMYANWDRYHMYFNTYDVEKQYAKYYVELSKKLKWGKVSNRGLYQAVKIATGFPKITAKLAYLGFHMSFRDAMKEVYELNRFPVRQQKMKYVLEINDCSQWEAEVAEDEVLGLIAEAVKKLARKSGRPSCAVQPK
ncbi:Os01g0970200 [Oryza sativa Japonica Group]|uniref:Os01g0970200 protein n=1 Tax=Oryza sativa subsp. japonica TaxID=39947 RepID=A0A0P0VDB5_ORYSJ|nr:Os01g0970200 [Oryza sativa Japonica Group]